MNAAASFLTSASLQQLCFYPWIFHLFVFSRTRSSPTHPTRPPLTLNLADTSTTAKMGHEDAVYLAKLAEQAERYEGMYS